MVVTQVQLPGERYVAVSSVVELPIHLKVASEIRPTVAATDIAAGNTSKGHCSGQRQPCSFFLCHKNRAAIQFGNIAVVPPSVTRVNVGDFAVFTVRRGSGQCAPCLMGRADMCQTGNYKEQGIRGLDGYQTCLLYTSRCV